MNAKKLQPSSSVTWFSLLNLLISAQRADTLIRVINTLTWRRFSHVRSKNFKNHLTIKTQKVRMIHKIKPQPKKHDHLRSRSQHGYSNNSKELRQHHH